MSIVSTNTQVMADGDPLVRASDTFLIAGCSFAIPAVVPIPHPCVQVQWVQTDLESQVFGDFTLNEESVGLCIAADMAPQGTVLINFTQPLVSGE